MFLIFGYITLLYLKHNALWEKWEKKNKKKKNKGFLTYQFVQQHIYCNDNISGNKCCRCNEGSLNMAHVHAAEANMTAFQRLNTILEP